MQHLTKTLPNGLTGKVRKFFASQWMQQDIKLKSTSNYDEDAMIRAVLSGKWRRSKLDDESAKIVIEKLTKFSRSKTPIQFTVPFGGYKLPKVPMSPHINWAEVFNVNFYRRQAERIASHYPYGINFIFTYVSGVLDMMNNFPSKNQDIYLNEFSTVLGCFSDSTINFGLYDVANELSEPSQIRDIVLENFERVSENWNDTPEDDRRLKIERARRNFAIVGCADYSNCTDEELELIIEKSAIYCEAVDSLSFRREYNKFGKRIQLVNIRGPKPAIHVASCDTTANHVSVGLGLMLERNSRQLQYIATGDYSNFSSEHKLYETTLKSQLTKGLAGLKKGLIISPS